MDNILWVKPDSSLAITFLTSEVTSAEEHAKQLQERGDLPADWTIAGYDVEWPQDGHPHEAYRWVNGKVQADMAIVAELAAKNAEPTKEELIAELQALTAKIQALGV